jgi:uncharacterized protein (DUF58 family)
MRIALLISVPLFVLGIALAGTHILVERLFILIMLVILAGFVYSRLALRGLKGQIKKPGQHYLPGQTFQIEARVENRTGWPRNFLNLYFTGASKKTSQTAFDLPPGSGFDWCERISYDRRGRYRLGPLVVESSDPLGVMRLKRVVDKGQDVIICPATQELPFFQAEAGPLRNKLLSQEVGAFSGIREYVPGDSLNRVHWRSSAHTGKLIVKEFEVDRSERIWVMPDLNKTVNAGNGVDTTAEYIITIAASIVKKYADAGRPVGLIAHSASFHHYPARSGHLNMWRIMEALALMQTDGRMPLSRLIYRSREQLTGNSVVVFITASDHRDIADSVINSNKLGLRAVAILVDRSSFGAAGSPQNLQRRLSSQNIPAYIVKKGSSLAEQLNSRKIYNSLTAGNGQHEFAA